MLEKRLCLATSTSFVTASDATTLATSTAQPAQPFATDRVGYLDGWRGVAIVMVLIDHFYPQPAFDSGDMGVDVFFCLSGLLMSNLLFVKRVPLSTFYKRRISRIVPTFALFVAAVYATAAWFGDVRGSTEIFSTFTFLRTYWPATPDMWTSGLPIGHLWSLNVEEHVYIVLSLLTLVAVFRGREVLALGAMAIVVMALYYVYEKSPRFNGTLFEIRTEIAASYVLCSAGYFLVRDRFVSKVRSWMPLAALALSAIGYLPHAHWWMSAIVSPLALAFSVNHLAQAPALFLRALGSRPLRQIGVWSFSIYLWQQPFYMYKNGLSGIVLLLGATLAGVVSYYLVENPCRTWLNRNW